MGNATCVIYMLRGRFTSCRRQKSSIIDIPVSCRRLRLTVEVYHRFDAPERREKRYTVLQKIDIKLHRYGRASGYFKIFYGD